MSNGPYILPSSKVLVLQVEWCASGQWVYLPFQEAYSPSAKVGPAVGLPKFSTPSAELLAFSPSRAVGPIVGTGVGIRVGGKVNVISLASTMPQDFPIGQTSIVLQFPTCALHLDWHSCAEKLVVQPMLRQFDFFFAVWLTTWNQPALVGPLVFKQLRSKPYNLIVDMSPIPSLSATLQGASPTTRHSPLSINIKFSHQGLERQKS